MIRFHTNRLIPLASALALAVLLLLTAAAGVQASPSGGDDRVALENAPDAYRLDHFWCYRTTSTPVNEVVGTRDQFTTAVVNLNVGAPVTFCNPVRKKHGDKVFEIVNPDAHLIMYNTGKPTVKIFDVEVDNQFGVQRLRVFGPATRLAVPTQKEGHAFPQDLDHFKCYKVKGEDPDAVVGLKDQFTSARNREVGVPVLLCNPTLKIHKGQTFDVKHPKWHLVCYKVTPKDFTIIRGTLNQFRQEPLTVQNANMLCAPSKKRIVQN
jgi:hypothetical protein